MLDRLRPRLTFANVVSVIALFVALGGASYAAFKVPKNSVGTKQLRRGAVTAKKLRHAAVTGDKIKAGAVTGATVRDGSLGAADVHASCPAGFARTGDVCFEKKDRPAGFWIDGLIECADAGLRLPTTAEMWAVATVLPRPAVDTDYWTSDLTSASEATFIRRGAGGNTGVEGGGSLAIARTYRCVTSQRP